MRWFKNFFQKLFKKFDYSIPNIYLNISQKEIDEELCRDRYIPMSEEEKKFLEELGELFDDQVDLLEYCGCAEETLQEVRKKRTEVLAIGNSIEIAEGNIPFVMAVPLGSLEGVYGQIVAIPVSGDYDIPFTVLIPLSYVDNFKGKLVLKGFKVETVSKTDSNKIEVIELPLPPYFIYNVELIKLV